MFDDRAKESKLYSATNSLRVAFISPYVAPYCIPARMRIDLDTRISSKHFFTGKDDPGRQWNIQSLPESFSIVRTIRLLTKRYHLLIPIGLPKALKSFQPDIIVGEQLGGLYTFVHLYAQKAKVPVLLRFEGTPHTERGYSGLRLALRRWLVSKTSGFLCYSEGARQYLESLGAEGFFYEIPYSVDDALYKRSNYQHQKKTFLFIGQLIERKGIRLLMDAFSKVVYAEPEARLWIAGSGPLRQSLEKGLAPYVAKKITWFGFCPAEKIAKLYQQAEIFVCPTLSDHGPMVQIEAAKSGLPIISSPFSGNAELVVKPGVNGDIVDPRDTDKLAQAMLRTLRSTDYDQMVRKSEELGRLHSPEREAKVTVESIIDFAGKL